MGMIGGILRGSGAAARLTRAARGLTEVFVPNATEAQELAHATQRAALEQLSGEVARPARGPFDRLVDGLNRLPRPLLAFGTLGLFVHAMTDPDAFAIRMQGLAHVPDPLWWLLGAIVGFYFGARELHYRRPPAEAPIALPEPVLSSWHAPREPAPDALAEDPQEENAALSDWRASRR
jgi:hypothetical protein